MASYDFSGWATKNDILCSDGRTIRRDAFADQDGARVPLVWNHMHDSVDEVLGYADLENRPEGVYAYCSLNDTEAGQRAKKIVKHNDICALSIYANHLTQRGGDVIHGMIREISLVHAGANKGAVIDNVMAHGDMSDDEAVISFVGYGDLELYHSDDEGEDMDNKKDTDESEETVKDVYNTLTDKQKKAVAIIVGQILEDEKKKNGASDEKTEDTSEKPVEHSDSLKEDLEDESEPDGEEDSEETVKDVYNTLTDKQKKVVDFLVGQAVAKAKDINNDSKGENSMKHCVFDHDERGTHLSHSDQAEILENAKDPTVGTLKNALKIYVHEHDMDLSHADGTAATSGFQAGTIEKLFPDPKELNPGAPELLTNDQGWVNRIINGVTKSPIPRVRTTQIDIREIETLMAKGYKKGNKKNLTGSPALLRRSTDPQTVYVKDALNRDDVVDITDFDYVQYMYNIDKIMLNETIARAIMIGDGRLDDAPDKIWPTHIRPIWTDDELYTMHVDVDFDGMKKTLQGSNTGANFGDEYVMAEAMVSTLLHATEDYRGSGTPDFFCTPNTLNTMLLARDMNGRRIYNTEAELATALGVKNIYRVKDFAGKTRTTTDNKKKELLGIYGNIADYVVGAVKGGQITKFDQFDIDFNQLKSLIETRFSGALAHVACFVAVEKDVTTTTSTGSGS